MTENVKPMRRTLFDCYSSNLCAWCHYHHAGVTVRQMRKKKCLARQCGALEKYSEHPFWEYRENIKRIKKERKAAGL